MPVSGVGWWAPQSIYKPQKTKQLKSPLTQVSPRDFPLDFTSLYMYTSKENNRKPGRSRRSVTQMDTTKEQSKDQNSSESDIVATPLVDALRAYFVGNQTLEMRTSAEVAA